MNENCNPWSHGGRRKNERYAGNVNRGGWGVAREEKRFVGRGGETGSSHRQSCDVLLLGKRTLLSTLSREASREYKVSQLKLFDINGLFFWGRGGAWGNW